MNIRDWVRRPGKRTKWHVVESVVAGDAVTRCGRRMDRLAYGGELRVSEVTPFTRMIGQPDLCRRCYLHPLPEDDGSTAPETEPE